MQEEDKPGTDMVEHMTTITVADATITGAAFIIPIDAPLPNEINNELVPSGTLLSRLRFLDADESEDSAFRFVPLSGAEFLALERIWRNLQTRKHVYVLTDLPGARYDVLFDTARRSIGLKALEWPTISEALIAHDIKLQRTRDTQPWKNELASPDEPFTPQQRRTPRSMSATPAQYSPDESLGGDEN